MTSDSSNDTIGKCWLRNRQEKSSYHVEIKVPRIVLILIDISLNLLVFKIKKNVNIY